MSWSSGEKNTLVDPRRTYNPPLETLETFSSRNEMFKWKCSLDYSATKLGSIPSSGKCCILFYAKVLRVLGTGNFLHTTPDFCPRPRIIILSSLFEPFLTFKAVN